MALEELVPIFSLEKQMMKKKSKDKQALQNELVMQIQEPP